MKLRMHAQLYLRFKRKRNCRKRDKNIGVDKKIK